MHSGNMPQSLYQNWQFAIEVNGFDVALFKKGQEAKTEFEEVAFSPAGSMFDQKVAAPSSDSIKLVASQWQLGPRLGPAAEERIAQRQ